MKEQDMGLRRNLMAAAALTAAIGGGGLVTAATSAAADTPEADSPITIQASCGTTLSPVVSGGRASWTVQCTSTQVRITGWVRDTSADGKCARVQARYPDGSTWTSASACPSGETQYFTSPYRTGRIVDAYLIVS
jgi:hypothetical protein